MKEIVKCLCGKELEIDWTKIPAYTKAMWIHCKHCGSEFNRSNPLYNNCKNKTREGINRRPALINWRWLSERCMTIRKDKKKKNSDS